MKNKNKYPIVTIASCDLARWDDPFSTCASEQLVYIKDAGAVSVIAATRPVFAKENSIFNLNYLQSGHLSISSEPESAVNSLPHFSHLIRGLT